MEFKLTGYYELSASAGKASSDVKKIISEANKNLLQRGTPRGQTGAKVTSFKTSGKKISVVIKSGRYVRPHDAMIRLRKALAQELGRKHKIGVRDSKVQRYEVSLETSRKPKKEIRVPFAKKVSVKNKKISLLFEDLSEEFLENNYLDRIISLVNDKVEAQYYEGKAEHWELLWESKVKSVSWDKDPTEEMVKRDWLKQGPGQGQWFYHAPVAAILRAMEEITIKEILEPLGYKEVIATKIVPLEVWEKTGHLAGSEAEIYYVSPPGTRAPEYWEEVVDLYKITRKAPVKEIRKRLRDPIGGITYAQCPPMYWAFEKKTLDKDELPLLLFDHSGPSARWEAGGKHGIERVNEFHRIEILFIGTPEQIIRIKDDLMDKYKHVFENIMELTWRTAFVTPWYLEQSGQLETEDEEKHVKGTIDFEAYMPYRGKPEDSEWLEFQNLSIVGDKYTNAFNIKSSGGAELWSGCSGVGLQRWAAVFLAQKGLDPEKWPKGFRKYLPKLPKEVKFL